MWGVRGVQGGRLCVPTDGLVFHCYRCMSAHGPHREGPRTLNISNIPKRKGQTAQKIYDSSVILSKIKSDVNVTVCNKAFLLFAGRLLK